MLTTTNFDGPAFNTRSRTVQQNITEHLTPQPNADTVTPDITTVKDTPDVTLKPLTADKLHAPTTDAEERPILQAHLQTSIKWKSPKAWG